MEHEAEIRTTIAREALEHRRNLPERIAMYELDSVRFGATGKTLDFYTRVAEGLRLKHREMMR